MLLEVRSHKVRQPGEVCFPGGRVEPGETIVEAAVRETCEELGLAPEDIEVTGELEPLIMGDGREVYPVAARVMLHLQGQPSNQPSSTQLHSTILSLSQLSLSKDEVSEVFLLPAAWLTANKPVHFDLAETADEDLPEQLLRYLANYGDYRKTGSTDYLEYEGHGIWGLTARIIKSLCI